MLLPFLSVDVLIQCQLSTIDQLSQLVQLQSNSALDIWTHSLALNKTIDIHVTSTHDYDRLFNLFPSNNCKPVVSRVHDWFHEQEQSFYASADSTGKNPDPFFDHYQSYNDIVKKLQEWEKKFPYYVQLNQSIGQSVQGRDLPAIKITNISHVEPKKAIFFNSGQHAREWIGPSTVLYLAYQLLTNPNASKILNQAEIYITPMQNPDGYEFSRSGKRNRLWRKNRRRNKFGIYGVDLNRNWDEHFGKVGSSQNPISETYHGPYAFSEPETKYLADYILSIPNRYAGIDFHSFGQLILRNWGWIDTPSKNEDVLKELGDGMKAVILRKSHVDYTSERGAALYPASGCTDDWMTTKAGMIGFTIELRDTGKYGFQLPESQIVSVGDEIWEAMLYYFDFILSHDIPVNEYVNAKEQNSSDILLNNLEDA